MAQFSPDQPLEERLRQIRIVEMAMYGGELLFLGLAILHITGIAKIFPMDLFAYAFGGIAVFQFLITKFIVIPSMTKKAHQDLP